MDGLKALRASASHILSVIIDSVSKIGWLLLLGAAGAIAAVSPAAPPLPDQQRREKRLYRRRVIYTGQATVLRFRSDSRSFRKTKG